VIRQPAEIASRLAIRESLQQVRHRMIRETEAFLNERLYRRNGGWATDERVSFMLNPGQNHPDRRQRPPRAEQSINVRTRPDVGTLIEVHPDPRGMVDDPRLKALESQLNELTDDRSSGDIVIGVQQVAVITAGFLSLLAMVRPRLVCQKRKLSLHGLRPECADLFRGTGLEELL
jgi:anti-anti-sigma regulatory factor